MAAQIDDASDGGYNPVFQMFVGKDAKEPDLVNLVAYSLYKKAKTEWIKKFKADKRRSPTADELTAYHETWTQMQIEAFRDRAQASLAAFGESVVDDAAPGILRDALRGTFWPEVFRSVFASFLYTLLLILVVLLLRWSGVDFLEMLEKANPSHSTIVPSPQQPMRSP